MIRGGFPVKDSVVRDLSYKAKRCVRMNGKRVMTYIIVSYLLNGIIIC